MADEPLEIKVGESEFRGLLDREKAVSDVNRAFPEQLRLLCDLTNYGTNLIPRCFSLSSDKELKDIVVLGVLLRQVAAMLDAVEILVSQGAVYAAGLQARTLFEASVYIDWILRNDTKEKASYYCVHNVRRQRMWAQRSQAGSPEAVAFAAIAPNLMGQLDPQYVQEAQQKIADIDRFLSQKHQAVNKAFDDCARKKRKKEVNWYEPLGMPRACFKNRFGLKSGTYL